MRKYKYKVVFKHGNEETFHCNSFVEAIVRGMNVAYDNAWDGHIESVTRENGNKVEHVKCVPTYVFEGNH